MSTNDEIQRLRALAGAGYLNDVERARLAELEGSARTTTVRTPANTTVTVRTPANTTARAQVAPPPEPVIADDEIFIPLNTDSFESGGVNFQPPPREAIYPGRCSGVMFPQGGADQFWFLFEGTETTFYGALVTSNLSRAEGDRPGAWKIKNVLDALGADYETHPGAGVQIRRSDLVGRACQVEWAYVDIKGKRELRIQNIYPPEQHIESL